MRIRAYLVACLVVAASILTATPALADDGDEDYILGPFGPWSAPENLGPPVNTRYNLFALFVCKILGLAFGAHPAVLRIVHPLAAPYAGHNLRHAHSPSSC